MTNIKIQPTNILKVTVGPSQTSKVISSQIAANTEALALVSSLLGLNDVDGTGLQDNYVLQYNSTDQKFKFVDPDQILQDAVPGGIPGDFINVLDTDLTRTDNIDFDGGNF